MTRFRPTFNYNVTVEYSSKADFLIVGNGQPSVVCVGSMFLYLCFINVSSY